MKQVDLQQYSFSQVDLQPSSNISGAFYDNSKKVLMITFRSNKSYLYFNIEQELIDNWKKADSVGKFFAEYIKWAKFEPIDK